MNEEELKLLDKIEELPKELNIEIRGLILSEVCLRKENQQLKEQLNKKYENVGTLTSEILYEENTRLINQQKEFIEWLEQKVKKYTPNLRVSELDEFGYRVAQYINAEVYEIPPEDVVKEVLSKYKEIIGVEM